MNIDETEELLQLAAVSKLKPCKQYGQRSWDLAGNAMTMQRTRKKINADKKKEEDNHVTSPDMQ